MAVDDQVQKVRSLITHHRRPAALLPSVADWHTLCSALDVIRDTELAFAAYADWGEISDVGGRYLLVYGVLQALLLQQDAVKKVCEVFQSPLSFSPSMNKIREIRSDSIGHPMSRKKDKIDKANFIQRVSLSYDGFALMTVLSDGKYSFQSVNIPELMDDQNKFVELALLGLVEKLRSDEMAHRQKHNDKKLENMFSGLGYAFSKIYGGTTGDTEFFFVGIHVREIKTCLRCFREALEQRGEWGSAVEDFYKLIEYPLQQLDEYAEDRGRTKLNDKDAYIFGSFVQSQVEHIKEIAKELDDEYHCCPVNKRIDSIG
jgi:hypothetical protein